MLDSNVSTYIDKDGNVQEVGSGGTVDASTLNGVITGTNGITTALNTAGDKVEVKIGEEFTSTGFIMHASNGKFTTIKPTQIVVQANDATYQEYIETDGKKIHHYEITGFSQGVPTAVDSVYLHQGNVKTLFGNQSIYGSGNIDLYVHSIRFETLYAQVNKGQASFSFEVISSNNIAIDSLTDLFTYLKNRKVPVCGTCSPTGDADYVAQYIDIVSSSNSYIYYIKDNATMTISLSNMDSSLTITDTVTTV